MGIILGIDLGTTNSAVAVFNERGISEVLHNPEGDNITPSVVQFDGDDIVVGKEAKNAHAILPDQTVAFAKRFMDAPHKLGFSYRGQEYTSIDISSIILKKLAEGATQATNEEIDGVVITVPAYFDTNAKEATKQAAEIAGLKVLRMVMEPTAAAIYFSHINDNSLNNKTVLVYDLGGGTFDVSMIKINGDSVEVLATAGDAKLGGKDIDEALIEYIKEVIAKEHPDADLDYNDTEVKAELYELAENAKKSLSQKSSVKLRFNSLKEFKHDLLREAFEKAIEHHIHESMNHVHIVVQQTQKPDHIVLVGGSTRIPMVSEMLEKEFGIKPMANVNPDEVVAQGAALLATKVAIEEGIASGDHLSKKVLSELKNLSVKDIAPHSLGFIYEDSYSGKIKNKILIQKGSNLPCEETIDGYGFDGQGVTFRLTQGEFEDPEHVEIIGNLEIQGDEDARGGRTGILITISQKEDGSISVKNKSMPSGKVYSLDVKSDNLLSQNEISNKKTELSKQSVE